MEDVRGKMDDVNITVQTLTFNRNNGKCKKGNG